VCEKRKSVAHDRDSEMPNACKFAGILPGEWRTWPLGRACHFASLRFVDGSNELPAHSPRRSHNRQPHCYP
jgi:hypothetical protein